MLHLGIIVVLRLFGVYNFSSHGYVNKKTKYGLNNLTNTVIIVPDITLLGLIFKTGFVNSCFFYSLWKFMKYDISIGVFFLSKQ
jgi:uncharacterized membrane protein YGL010W